MLEESIKRSIIFVFLIFGIVICKNHDCRGSSLEEIYKLDKVIKSGEKSTQGYKNEFRHPRYADKCVYV